MSRFGKLPLAAFALLLVSQRSHAQEGFALDRYDPAVVGSDWFDGDSLDFRGHGRAALGIIGDYAREPLVAKDASGDVVATPVENQLFVHLGAGVILWNRLRLDLNLPLAVWNEGEPATIGGVAYAAPSDEALGDLRLGADLRLVGEYRKPFSLAVGTRVRLPTGSRSAYTSDGSTQLGGRVLAAGDLAWFAYSAHVGVNGRFESTEVDGVAVGTELIFGATAGLRFADKRALLGAEWFGGGGLVKGQAFDPKTMPQELLGSFSYRVGEVLLGAAAGPGLTDAFGAPTARGLLRLVWFPEPEVPKPPPPAPPPAPPPDCDADGVIDTVDACPGTPGVRTDDPKTNGCPPPDDRDKDGIIDSLDACPVEPGVATDDPKTNGCDPDPDRDGILGKADACPKAAGKPNVNPALNGCPRVVITDKNLEIKEHIEFVTGSAEIDKQSFELLNAVAEILVAHPEVEVVDIEGHTDNRGAAAMNRKLSKRRAESVKRYFVEHGVEEKRLLANGRGPDVPVADNTTEEGRAANRRVEFHIRQRAAKPPSEEIQSP